LVPGAGAERRGLGCRPLVFDLCTRTTTQQQIMIRSTGLSGAILYFLVMVR